MSQIAASSHIDDLRREAERATLARQARRQTRIGRPNPVRRAFGWWLVDTGLRLAGGTRARPSIS
jgi:hypothetical protein